MLFFTFSQVLSETVKENKGSETRDIFHPLVFGGSCRYSGSVDLANILNMGKVSVRCAWRGGVRGRSEMGQMCISLVRQ